ncbi:penicillin-binding protein [Algivirga pacifica]|uniref:Penicillin-binding protein n=1 Tax=Algivirga pacifica TaxID=1162670 RepID=A0ABP9D405_9BACT
MAGIRSSILLRVRLVFAGCVLIALAIIGKIGYVQWIEGDHWMKIAEQGGLQFRTVKATRGNILSDNGSLLSTSIPFYKLAIDPTIPADSVFHQGIDSLSVLLSGFFQEKTAEAYKAEIVAARQKGRQYKVLSSKLIHFRDKKKLGTWPIFREGRQRGGVIFEKTEKRFRPFNEMARRTIGFVREDQDNKVVGRGLEISFNDHLAGRNGQALYQRISGGRWKPLYDEDFVNTENGYSIETTLNVEFQEFISETLRQALLKHLANYGVAILMEVETGEVKALVNLTQNGKGDYVETLNYAVQTPVEPGSTFKLASMMALLEEVGSDISIHDTISTGDGRYEFYDNCVMTDAARWGFGKLSVQQVFEKSSNIGVSKLMARHFQQDPESFLEYLEKFHLTKPIAFQLDGVGRPNINRPGDPLWSGCSLPWMSIGYELQLTPLQLTTFFNSVANNGKMIQPMLVKKVLDGNQVKEVFEPQILVDKVCSNKTLEILQNMLVGVVERGTAKGIYTTQYSIAGKTGTTKKLHNGRYTNNHYASFCGYFPADDPKYTLFIAIDNPNGKDQHGGQVAAPVFKTISDMLYSRTMSYTLENVSEGYESLPYIQAGNYKDLSYLADEFDLNQEALLEEEWTRTSVKGDTVFWGKNLHGPNVVADVRGMTLKDAMYLLENQQLKVHFRGRGRVRKQSIAPGSRAVRGSHIYLTLSP